MSGLAYNSNGNVVNVGDRVSIRGVISSISGTAENATATIQTPLAAGTISVSVLDLYTPEGVSTGAAQGNLLTVGNDCTVAGLVTAIAGIATSGVLGTNTALLTVQLFRSGLSVSVPSGCTNSDNV